MLGIKEARPAKLFLIGLSYGVEPHSRPRRRQSDNTEQDVRAIKAVSMSPIVGEKKYMGTREMGYTISY